MAEVSPATCRAIARTIRNLLDEADARRAWSTGSRPPLQREDVRAARAELLAIARRFDDGEPIAPQAAVLAAQLVWDCASPVYAEGDFSVWEWARAILDGLGDRAAA
jgi:hypothetical protein